MENLKKKNARLNDAIEASHEVLKTLNYMNRKVDSAGGKAIIVEAGRIGSSWYRKWSDGFIEQGGCVKISSGENGAITITLNTGFSTSNYTAFCNTYTSMESNKESVGIKTKSTSSFTAYSRTSEVAWRDWVAFGY